MLKILIFYLLFGGQEPENVCRLLHNIWSKETNDFISETRDRAIKYLKERKYKN